MNRDDLPPGPQISQRTAPQNQGDLDLTDVPNGLLPDGEEAIREKVEAEEEKIKIIRCYKDQNRICDNTCAAFTAEFEILQGKAYSQCLDLILQDYIAKGIQDVALTLPGARRFAPINQMPE